MASAGYFLIIILCIYGFTAVYAGESLFQIVGKRVAVPEQEYHGHHSSGARHESVDDVIDDVSAGEIWDEDRMMKMLGIEDGEDEEEIESSLETQGEDTEVPSLLSALYNKINEPGSNIVPAKCRLPGMKGNVVRMLNNKGYILYQDDTHVIVELQFSMKHAFHEYENVTEAQLKVSVPEIGKHDRELWSWMASNGLISAPLYKYDIYLTSDKTINNIRRQLYEMKTDMKNGEKTDSVQKQITTVLGRSLITKSFGKNQNTRKLSIDVKPLVNKWGSAFFKKKRLTLSRAVLVVTIETDSFVTKQCPQAMLSKPRLLLVSLDKRQCPMPVTSYLGDDVSIDDVITDDEKVIERHKRDLQDEKNTKKRKRKRKGRRKSKAKNPYTVQDMREGKSSRTPDLVPGESLHNPQSRSTRSTICRRYPMYVSFNDVGWGEWIIAPRGYQAYRCAGECPYPLGGRLNGTNHAVLVTMMHSVDPWSTPQPCCVPTSLRAMSLLYFDTGKNVVLRQYEDMVVGTCGCR